MAHQPMCRANLTTWTCNCGVSPSQPTYSWLIFSIRKVTFDKLSMKNSPTSHMCFNHFTLFYFALLINFGGKRFILPVCGTFAFAPVWDCILFNTCIVVSGILFSFFCLFVLFIHSLRLLGNHFFLSSESHFRTLASRVRSPFIQRTKKTGREKKQESSLIP